MDFKNILTKENYFATLKVDENEFLEASRLVYDGVRDIRRAVLLGAVFEDISDTESETESEEDEDDEDSYIEVTQDEAPREVDEYPEVEGYGIETAVDAMKQLPEEERSQIAEKVEEFLTEQRRFRQEVAKWEAEGNELVRLAVVIRDILVTMTDFTQGEVSSHWSTPRYSSLIGPGAAADQQGHHHRSAENQRGWVSAGQGGNRYFYFKA